MRFQFSGRVLACGVAAVVLLTASPLWAGPLYSASFDGTVGTQPTDWVPLVGTTGAPGWQISPSGEYRFDETAINGLSHFTGTFTSGQLGSSFADGTVEAHFRKSSGGYTGLAARILNASNFYHARLIGDNLQIYRFVGGSASQLGPSVSAAGYDSGETWKITMALVGTTITATVFDQSGSQVASLTRQDSSFSSGTVGVRGGAPSAWEDFLVAAPAVLNVDISLTGGDVQEGFQSFVETNDLGSYSSSPKTLWMDSQLGNENRVRVELASAGGGRMGFRDRGDVTHALGDLAEDFVFNLDGTRLNLTLGSLKPGKYDITTYHHDLTTSISGTLDTSVDDARGSGQPRTSGAAITNGATPSAVGSTSFSFYSDGVNPVVVHIDEATANLALLNGFALRPAVDSLRVDFALAGTANDVQDGFVGFSRDLTTTGQQTEVYSSSLGSNGTVTVRAAAQDGTLQWRDRGDSGAAELADVAEDFVFDQDWIELTLEGLAPSAYLMTTYHHDTTHVGSLLNIDVWDDLGDGRRAVSGLVQTVSSGGNPDLATFLIYSDGSPVTIRFTDLGTGTDPIARLNGFALTAVVPEPSALALAGLGLCGFMLFGARRGRSARQARP